MPAPCFCSKKQQHEQSPRIPSAPLLSPEGIRQKRIESPAKNHPLSEGGFCEGKRCGGFAGESGRPGGQESRGQVAGDCRKAFFVVMGLPDMAKTI